MLLLTGIILLAQFFAYISKRQVIAGYATLFPDAKSLGISRYRIMQTALERQAPAALLSDINKFNVPIGAEAGVMNLQGTNDRIVPVSLLAVANPTTAFTGLAYSLNAYLLRNSAATTDYAILEGIAERYNNTERDEIRYTLSSPAYLGLIGMLALAGYFFYSHSGEGLTVTFTRLLQYMHYLLLPLFFGILLRQLLRNQFFQKAQERNALRRTAFYTFLQTELLPSLNPSPEGSLRSLQNQMQRFGQDFSTNLNRLDGLLVRNYDALLAQSQLLDSINKSDMVAISTANVTVLQELQKSTDLLSGFNSYLVQVEGLLATLQKSVAKMNEFMARTETIEDLAGRALAATNENRQMMAFLQSHYQELDKSRQLLADGVVDVNRTLQGALDDLQRFTQEKIDRIRAMETYEAERLSSTEGNEERRQLRETLEELRRLLARQG